MKYTLFLTFLFLFQSSQFHAQNELDNIDKLIDKMCFNFEANKELDDSLRLAILNQKFIIPFLDQYSESEQSDKEMLLFYRFQKQCEIFKEFILRIDPPKTDSWVSLTSKPKITISRDEIKKIKKIKRFYYIENSGEKTEVSIKKKYWIESFPDGTYSKLYFKWTENNKFELKFIESNNDIRKYFSSQGEVYNYEVISKEDNYYWIYIDSQKKSETLKFKLFIE